jgi:hypothetical protein
MSQETIERGETEKAGKVEVTVDSKDRKVRPGDYTVSAFKSEVKVDAAKELEQLINGKYEPLNDAATITIHGGETFLSHVRRGGSSWE